jgi:hypothetical protein
MTKQKRTKLQIMGLIIVSLLIAAGTYGFAQAEATGTTGLLSVGYGVQSQYEVTKINYILDEELPTDFLAVSFELAQDPMALQVGISETKSDQIIWADRCEFNGYKWVCSFADGIDVRQANWLYVE